MKVSAKVAHYLEKMQKKSNKQKQIENTHKKCSFNTCNEPGDALIYNTETINRLIIIRNRERKYFNSNEYKEFKNNLQIGIKNFISKMSKQVGTAMFLRFAKSMSIGQIAKAMKCSKSSEQTYLCRGTKYIKNYLNQPLKTLIFSGF